MEDQITDTILMIRPVAFRKNAETAVNNYFQQDPASQPTEIQRNALHEFDSMVTMLRDHGVQVLVLEDNPEPGTPDSIFPNNWVSFHQDGSVITYPMYARNRRSERRMEIIEHLKEYFVVNRLMSLTHWEERESYLEGTGSLILDRVNHVAYAAVSDRTNPEVIADFEHRTGYSVIQFNALQTVEGNRLPIYHTNVMMAIGERFAVICLDSIDDLNERDRVKDSLESNKKQVISITEEQMHHFAGNMLQVRNSTGHRFVAMSEAAYRSLSEEQKDALSEHGELLHSPIPTIENLGGGSVRCMMAEVFLPRLEKARKEV